MGFALPPEPRAKYCERRGHGQRDSTYLGVLSPHDLRERARATAPERREESARVHARAKQKRDAADALWIAGFSAEALRLATEARDLLGVASEAEALPALDSDVTPEQSERFHALQSETAALLDKQLADVVDQRQSDGCRSTESRSPPRSLCCDRRRNGVPAHATYVEGRGLGELGRRYDASKGVDGSDRSDWLLPDRTSGWLEVQILPRRKIKRLHVTNARNVPYNDRATNEFHVDVFDKGQLVKQFDGKFDGFSPDPVTRTFDIGMKADKVRLTVKSFYVSGGGFAEVSVATSTATQ